MPRDRHRARQHRFTRLFDAIAAPRPDALAVEADMVRVLHRLMGRHGNQPSRRPEPSPSVTRALRRLDEAPELPVTLAELAALSGVSRDRRRPRVSNGLISVALAPPATPR